MEILKPSAIELAAIAAPFVVDNYSTQEALERAWILIESAESFLVWKNNQVEND